MFFASEWFIHHLPREQRPMNRLFYALSDVELRRHNIFLALDIGIIDAATAERLLQQLTTEEEELGRGVAFAHEISRLCPAKSSRRMVTRN